jgi:NADPH:quinone reductase-like Zn-dependent oxidoreductase
MKAAVYERYGPPEVLHLAEVEKPVPTDGELLVRVHAATVAAGDWRMRRPSPFAARLYNGLFRPKRVNILGFELAGRVEAVGKKVTRFQVGDDVFSFTGFGFGAHAEYRCLRESGSISKFGLVSLKPTNMSYGEAAAVPVGGLTAQALLRKGRVAPGQSVLVYGASGSVGTYAVQLAKAQGANVTAVCSGANLELVQSLGADAVIDYQKQDVASRGPVHDVVFDAVGKLPGVRARDALKKGGVFVSVKGSPKLEAGDLDLLKGLIEQGKLRAVIDRTYPLERIVAAHEYVEMGHKKGNVVIEVYSRAHGRDE